MLHVHEWDLLSIEYLIFSLSRLLALTTMLSLIVSLVKIINAKPAVLFANNMYKSQFITIYN